jgi:hypothetical protein
MVNFVNKFILFHFTKKLEWLNFFKLVFENDLAYLFVAKVTCADITELTGQSSKTVFFCNLRLWVSSTGQHYHFQPGTTTLSITTISIMPFSITTFSTKGLVNDTEHKWHWAWVILSITMLCLVLSAVVMLNVAFHLLLCLASLCWMSLCWVSWRLQPCPIFVGMPRTHREWSILG